MNLYSGPITNFNFYITCCLVAPERLSQEYPVVVVTEEDFLVSKKRA